VPRVVDISLDRETKASAGPENLFFAAASRHRHYLIYIYIYIYHIY